MGRRACANAVAYGECECAMPPQAKARYNSSCVGVSDDGRRSPSSTRPVSSATGTMWAGVSSSYGTPLDRKSTRLNSSHGYISYAVFCLKKKKKKKKKNKKKKKIIKKKIIEECTYEIWRDSE